MELIPMADGGAEDTGLRQLTVSESAARLMDIQVAPVQRRFVTADVRMVGKVEYDETSLAYITAWVPGRLDRLYVDYTGVPVRQGDHLVRLYSPELISAQQELLQALQARRSAQSGNAGILRDLTDSTVEAAREKLRLWGLTPEQIQDIEAAGKVSEHMTIYAPTDGIVIHKDAREGMYVQTGTRIYTIADLSHVWVKLDAYESDLQWLRYAQEVEFTTVSYPGEVFRGTISFIDPVLEEKTRTVKVRVNVDNPDGRLKPGMFVKAAVHSRIGAGGEVVSARLAGKWICPMHPEEIEDGPGDCDQCGMPLVTAESLGYVDQSGSDAEEPLVIPASAALVTGTRAIVYVKLPDTEKPTFEGREIVLGPRAGDDYLVRSGLEEGEKVVTRGNFKIDSSLQILARPSMMTPDGSGGMQMHNHGEAPAGGGGHEQGHGGAAGLEPLSVHQLRTVARQAQQAQQASASGDLEAIHAAYVRLGEAIEQVDEDLLTGKALPLWKEYRMRLGNDVVEGRTAEDLEEASRIAASVEANRSAMVQALGLSVDGPDRNAAAPLDPQFRTGLAELYGGYFKIQQALAADDPQAAAQAGRTALEALASVQAESLSGENLTTWRDAAGELKASLQDLTAAKELQALREHFHRLSQAMIAVAHQFGAAGEGTLYLSHCPMAFDNRGADWLQAQPKIRNPYFGDLMLECGSVKGVIEQK